MSDTTAQPRRRRRIDASSPVVWALAALVLLMVFNAVVNPGFFAVRLQDGNVYGPIVDVLKNGAPTLLIAVGMTLVIATRGIDLSVGAVLAIGGAVAWTVVERSPEPASAGTAVRAVGLAIIAAVVLGAWNGFLVSVIGIQPIIATLVLMTAGRGLAMLVTDGQIITASNPAFTWLGGGRVLGLPAQVVITLGVVLLVALVTRRTALGTLIEAVGTNPEAARLAGVKARTITWTVYVFVAVAAGIAGLMVSANISAADANRAGLFIELDAILAVVIGGTSLAGGRYSITGTVIGAVILQALTTTVLTMGMPDEYIRVFKAVVIIAVFLLQAPKVRGALRRRRRGSPPPPPDGTAAPVVVPPAPDEVVAGAADDSSADGAAGPPPARSGRPDAFPAPAAADSGALR